MGTILLIAVMAMFINNFVVVQFLGICPFLGVSKDTKSALGMGVAVTFVMTITCLITYPIYTMVLVPLGLEYLEVIHNLWYNIAAEGRSAKVSAGSAAESLTGSTSPFYSIKRGGS